MNISKKIFFFFSNSDADETKNWINEKDKVLSSDDYGKDLASVNALLRKHEALERDLAAVEDKVNFFFLQNLISVLLYSRWYCDTLVVNFDLWFWEKGETSYWEVRAFVHPMVSISSLQVTALGQESNQLQEAHPDSADEIAVKQDEIVTAWGNLKDKVWCIRILLIIIVAFLHRNYTL